MTEETERYTFYIKSWERNSPIQVTIFLISVGDVTLDKTCGAHCENASQIFLFLNYM